MEINSEPLEPQMQYTCLNIYMTVFHDFNVKVLKFFHGIW